jgi:hypothetical protein
LIYNYDINAWDAFSNGELSHSVKILNDKGDIEILKNNEVVMGFNINHYDYQSLALIR